MKVKRILLAGAILFASSSTFASHATAVQAAPTDCGSYSLCSLPAPGGFYVGGTAMYVVPAETNIGMITDSWQYASANGSVTSLSKPARMRYNWAGAVNLGYDFPGTANNVELNYVYLFSNTHNVNDTAGGPVSFGSILFNINLLLAPGENLVSDSYLKYVFNQVDVNVGHRITSGRVELHPSVGVRYADLSHALPFSEGFVRSRFHGVGPLVGVDGHYDFCYGLGLAAHFDSSLLMGTVVANSHIALGPLSSYYVSPSTNRLVTTVGGRLGLDYKYMMPNAFSAKLELGYQANEYIGAFDILTGWFGPPSVQRISSINTTNFSYAGPYLNLTFHT